MSGDGDVATRLHGLDARAWGSLLRAVRALRDPSEDLAALLSRPTSELSSGPSRRALCEAIVASEGALAALLDDAALPVAVHVVIAADGGAGAATGGSPDREERSATASDGTARAEDRARTLRRSLEEERRRREGAEVRAASAEARADAADAERAELSAHAEALARDVAAAQDEVVQAGARAERRAEGRIASLEQDLAEARRALEELRRDHERVQAELSAALTEGAALAARAADREGRAGIAAAAAGARPIVVPDELESGTTEEARWLAGRARMLLVDGYNAALMLRPDRPLEEQRRWLVERLRPLAHRAELATVVVFDGAGTSGRMRDTGGIEVRFTAGGTIADDEIVFAVAATDVPVLVVTDDAELGRRVRAEGGNVVGVVHLPGIVDG
jgi:hypothetical protein